MANHKFKVSAGITTPVQPPAGKKRKSGCGGTEHEGLRLMHAFLRIKNERRRASLIKQAELMADAGE
jgi:hypothetical protein